MTGLAGVAGLPAVLLLVTAGEASLAIGRAPVLGPKIETGGSLVRTILPEGPEWSFMLHLRAAGDRMGFCFLLLPGEILAGPPFLEPRFCWAACLKDGDAAASDMAAAPPCPKAPAQVAADVDGDL